jgi:hypothetical protein
MHRGRLAFLLNARDRSCATMAAATSAAIAPPAIERKLVWPLVRFRAVARPRGLGRLDASTTSAITLHRPSIALCFHATNIASPRRADYCCLDLTGRNSSHPSAARATFKQRNLVNSIRISSDIIWPMASEPRLHTCA